MISVFGDESQSNASATYGLVALGDEHLSLLDKIVAAACSMLHAEAPEPLHCRVLFHDSARAKSAFSAASLQEVRAACAFVIRETARLNVAFYFGRVARDTAPKVLYVPMVDGARPGHVIDARMKLELPHLQYFAYGAAATRACDTLPRPATRLGDRGHSAWRLQF